MSFSIFKIIFFLQRKLHINKINNIFYNCDFCNHKTLSKLNMKTHMDFHHIQATDVSEITCSYCSKVWPSKIARDRHEKYFHLTKKGKFPCDDCGKTFGKEHNLKCHIDLVHVFGNFPCNKCDMMFNTKRKLSYHKAAVHIDKRPCEVCGKLYSSGTLYNRHMKRTHSTDLKCKFEGCTKVYLTLSSLRYHTENEHEPSKNRQCSKCNSVFSTNLGLRRHNKRSHSERTFCCEIEGCKYSSTRKEYLRLHVMNHKNVDAVRRNELLQKLVPKPRN